MARKPTAPVLNLVTNPDRTVFTPADTASEYLVKIGLKHTGPITDRNYERLRQAALDAGIVLSVRLA